MKNYRVIVSPSFVITTIMYALPCPIFFEMDNAYGEQGVNFVVNDDDNDYDKTMMYSQQQLETECKSPCLSSAEMCIAMCA